MVPSYPADLVDLDHQSDLEDRQVPEDLACPLDRKHLLDHDRQLHQADPVDHARLEILENPSDPWNQTVLVRQSNLDYLARPVDHLYLCGLCILEHLLDQERQQGQTRLEHRVRQLGQPCLQDR